MLATMAVALLPIAVVWGARVGRVISSPWLCACVTVSLSLIVSGAGSWYWKRRPGSGDILFSDLLLWGWLRRLHVEHQLDDAAKALGLATPGVSPSPASARTEDSRASTDRRLELLTRLADALEAHDPYVDGHSRRVARHATMVARKLGLPAVEVAKVARAAAVHDVGKLRLPREILMKPGTLTAAEFEILKRHSTEGAEMVACLGDPELTAIVRHHHERLDGSGYPAGLRGAQIPLGARIIAVADTFDAITSARPYRPAARHKQAIDILINEAGVQLDPDTVRAFVSYYSGSRILVLWAILAAIPQRAVGWARRTAAPAHSVSAMPTAASTAATLAIGAVAVIPPIGIGHSRAQPDGHHQPPRGQVAAAFPAVTPIKPPAGSHPRARGARAAATRTVPLRQVPGGRPVVPNLRRAPGTAPAASRPSGGTPGTHSRGSRSRGLTTGSPGIPSRRHPGGSSSGSGRGTGGGLSGGSGGGSSSGAGGGSIGATGGTPPSGSGGVTTSDPAVGTAGNSGGGVTPAPSNGTTGVTSTGDTSGGTTSETAGATTTGGTTGGTTSATTGGGAPPSQPTTKAQCMNGGYVGYGFKNQGQCIDVVVHKSPQPGKP
ncbi:MAG: HD domain-containing phosphohydrolase [Solirubrobacteraceae bacterium]